MQPAIPRLAELKESRPAIIMTAQKMRGRSRPVARDSIMNSRKKSIRSHAMSILAIAGPGLLETAREKVQQLAGEFKMNDN